MRNPLVTICNLAMIARWRERILKRFSGSDALFQYAMTLSLGFLAPWFMFAGKRLLHLPFIAIAALVILRLIMRPPYRHLVADVLKSAAGVTLLLLLVYAAAHVPQVIAWGDVEGHIPRLLGKPVVLGLSVILLAYIWATPDEPYRGATEAVFFCGILVFVILFSAESAKNFAMKQIIGWEWRPAYAYFVAPVIKMNRSLEAFCPFLFLLPLVLGGRQHRQDLSLKWWQRPSIIFHILVAWTLLASLTSFGVYGGKHPYLRHINSESVQLGLIISYFTYLLAKFQPILVTRLVFAGLIFGILLAPVLFHFGTAVIGSLGGDQLQTLSIRLDIWQAASIATAEHPIWGWGVESTRYLQLDLAGKRSHPHNGFLQIWLDLGALGAIIVAVLFALGWRSLSNMPPEAKPAVLAATVMLALLAATTHSIWQVWFMALITMVICLMHILSKSNQDEIF